MPRSCTELVMREKWRLWHSPNGVLTKLIFFKTSLRRVFALEVQMTEVMTRIELGGDLGKFMVRPIID